MFISAVSLRVSFLHARHWPTGCTVVSNEKRVLIKRSRSVSETAASAVHHTSFSGGPRDSSAELGTTGIIQLYPLPYVYTVRSDLCEHLPTSGSAAIVRIQYPNMEKRVRLAGFTRISARYKSKI